MGKQTKKIGFWILTALVVGNMVGSGVFLLPASLASIGTISIYSWALTGVGAIFLALVFGRLGSLFPKTGGPYVFAREAFGDFVGFQVAYNYWIYMWVGNAAIAVAMTGYLSVFFPALGTNPALAFGVTAGIVWLITLINAVGVRFAGMFQLITSIIKLLPLALIIIFGFFHVRPENWSAFNLTGGSDFSAISRGAILTMWAFLGIECACIPGDDVKNPKKNIPRATIVGVIIVCVIYIASTAAIMGLVDVQTLSESSSPYSDAAMALFGPWGSWLVSAGAVVACFGALNGWILLQGQIPYAAAQDGLFPKSFKYKSQQGVPLFGLITSSTLITLLLIFNFHKKLVDQFTFTILLATLAALITYLYCTMAEIIITVKQNLPRKKIFRLSVLSLIACIYTFWTIYSAGPETVFYGALLLLTSIPLYARIAWKQKLPR
ncbi:MAG: amino acid permease [Simkaniaceae bacterium]|nr:amino acid permease [Simkaniaceae bacterium]